MSRWRQKLDLVAVALAAVSFAAACAPSETGVFQTQTGDPVIAISEGACASTCPVYDLTLRPDGRYLLNGERFVKATGVTEGNVGTNAWTAADAVLKSAEFWTMKEIQTPRTLPNCQTGAPTVRVTWRTGEGKEKTVIYDAGCGVERTREMISALRVAMRFDDLVWTNDTFDPATGERS
ncbi:MAG: DUF6438 domain-containing protein [Alphaproteobacteria bacterium]|nr:DUF6438 domain-containing protein [Alphaproteobacteria bacterium]